MLESIKVSGCQFSDQFIQPRSEKSGTFFVSFATIVYVRSSNKTDFLSKARTKYFFF